MSFKLRFGPEDVRSLREERVFDGHFSVDRVTLQHRDFAGGWCEPVTREVFERGDSVGVLPYDPDRDAFVLIEQFRAGSRRDSQSPWMLELIAGVMEPGESEEAVLRREALEEAACELSELLPIAHYYPSAGACSEKVGLYCGRVLTAGLGEIHGLEGEGENILVHSVPRASALELMSQGRVNNGHTLMALQWFALHWDELAERWGGGLKASE